MRFNEFITEAANPAQQAAIAIHKKEEGVAEDKEKNHWYDAGVKDATRGARPNPRTYLPTLKDKQAKHPEELDFYMNGYKSVPQGVAEGSGPEKKMTVDQALEIAKKNNSLFFPLMYIYLIFLLY